MLRSFLASLVPVLALCLTPGCGSHAASPAAPPGNETTPARSEPAPETAQGNRADTQGPQAKPTATQEPNAPKQAGTPPVKPAPANQPGKEPAKTPAKATDPAQASTPAPTPGKTPGADPSAAASPQADPEYIVASWYEVGSNAPTNLFSLSPVLINKGWKAYLFDPPPQGGKSMYQQVMTFGPDEVIFHRPFGEPVGAKAMNLGAYLLAKKDPRLSKVTDLSAFVDAFSEFYVRDGRKRMTFYFGYLVGADEPWVGKSRDEKKAMAKECLLPVKMLRDKLVDAAHPIPVRVAIDSFAAQDPSQAKWDDFAIVVEVCREWNLPIDAEPWPVKNFPYVDDPNTRFIVVEHFIKHGETGVWAAPRNKIVGPHRIIPYMYAPPPEEKRDPVTRAVAHLRKEGAIAWAGWDLSITAAELKRRAAAAK